MTHMERALSLARKAVGSASPNPAVGAVVVKDGAVVGEGWTQPAGQAHAEVMAILQAGADSAGATLYTTLEPCGHHGRTPPCTAAIAAAGIAEVRCAVIDPNPKVDGSGLAQLEDRGIRTHAGEGAEEARELIEAYAKFITTGLPFVTAKFAMTLDGKIATRSGDSRWITGEEARVYVHALRAASDAIMVGVNTVLADDPQLTARDDRGSPLERQPLRVVVDGRGRTPAHARLLSEQGQTLVVTSSASDEGRRGLTEAGAQVESLPGDCGDVDLGALLKLLAKREKTSVLVEGGGTLLGSMFDLGLVDKVVAFVSPTIVGGEDAPSPVAGRGVGRMSEAMRLHRVKVMETGGDVAVIGYTGARGDVHGDS